MRAHSVCAAPLAQHTQARTERRRPPRSRGARRRSPAVGRPPALSSARVRASGGASCLVLTPRPRSFALQRRLRLDRGLRRLPSLTSSSHTLTPPPIPPSAAARPTPGRSPRRSPPRRRRARRAAPRARRWRSAWRSARCSETKGRRPPSVCPCLAPSLFCSLCTITPCSACCAARVVSNTKQMPCFLNPKPPPTTLCPSPLFTYLSRERGMFSHCVICLCCSRSTDVVIRRLPKQVVVKGQ